MYEYSKIKKQDFKIMDKSGALNFLKYISYIELFKTKLFNTKVVKTVIQNIKKENTKPKYLY